MENKIHDYFYNRKVKLIEKTNENWYLVFDNNNNNKTPEDRVLWYCVKCRAITCNENHFRNDPLHEEALRKRNILRKILIY